MSTRIAKGVAAAPERSVADFNHSPFVVLLQRENARVPCAFSEGMINEIGASLNAVSYVDTWWNIRLFRVDSGAPWPLRRDQVLRCFLNFTEIDRDDAAYGQEKSIEVHILYDREKLTDGTGALRIVPVEEVVRFQYDTNFKPFPLESELLIKHPYLMSVEEYGKWVKASAA